MSEILELRGRLAVAVETERMLKAGIDTDIDELRLLANKFESTSDLKGERIVVVSQRLKSEIDKYRNVVALITLLKKELGE